MFEQFKQKLRNELSPINENIAQHHTKKLMKNQDLMDYIGCSYTTIEKLRTSKNYLN